MPLFNSRISLYQSVITCISLSSTHFGVVFSRHPPSPSSPDYIVDTIRSSCRDCGWGTSGGWRRTVGLVTVNTGGSGGATTAAVWGICLRGARQVCGWVGGRLGVVPRRVRYPDTINTERWDVHQFLVLVYWLRCCLDGFFSRTIYTVPLLVVMGWASAISLRNLICQRSWFFRLPFVRTTSQLNQYSVGAPPRAFCIHTYMWEMGMPFIVLTLRLGGTDATNVIDLVRYLVYL